MNNRKKAYIWLIIIIAAIYFTLLMILFLTETSTPAGNIDSFGDAFWYSIVTLTTVGYGDRTPVTRLGRGVGLVFIILSAGVLVTLFGTVLQFITGHALPCLALKFLRKKNWYYFASFCPQAETLAGNLAKEDKNAVIIFGATKDKAEEMPDYDCFFINVSLEKIVAIKGNAGSRVKVFLLETNDMGKAHKSSELAKLPIDVYARTINGNDITCGNIHFFHSYDCCARHYWRSNPLSSSEDDIVIIGFGNYGRAVLERAILTNILSPDQAVNYHIFGEYKDFLALHPHLQMMFSINKERVTGDSLFFYDDDWKEHRVLMGKADRIIICEDKEKDGWKDYWEINKFYAATGTISLRCSREIPEVPCFGTIKEIYTTNNILKTNLNNAAITINELFRRSVDYETKSWEELDDFHRQSKIAAADHILMKARILLEDETIKRLTPKIVGNAYWRYRDTVDRHADREYYQKIDHIRWLRFYTYYNYVYGPEKNDILRTHPMILPFDQLTPEQKQERNSAWELMSKISAEVKSFE